MSSSRVGLAGLVGLDISLALVFALVFAFGTAACSVDGVTFKGPTQLAEDCSTPGDEDGDGLADCEDSICGALAQCARPPSCTDERKNGDEIDVDCGGSCPSCGPGKACVADSGCAGSGICDARTCRPALSCKEILEHYPRATNGAYTIAPIPPFMTTPITPFSVVCDMVRDGGGWTLLLKSKGDAVLAFGAPEWVSSTLLNPTDVTLTPGNAKFQSFVSLPIRKLRGELDGFLFTQIAETRTLAVEIFNRGPIEKTPYPTFNTGAPNWSAQPNCRIFGTNLAYSTPVRFGWVANQEANCQSNDTGIGLGVNVYGAGYRCTSSECSAGPVDASGIGFLWGRDDP